MLQMAIAADRLTRGRGKLFATHATMIWHADTAPILVKVSGNGRLERSYTHGIRNIAKKRGPVFVVPVAIAFPTAETTIKQMIWSDRSPVRPEVYVTIREMTKVANQTGTVRSNVSICP